MRVRTRSTVAQQTDGVYYSKYATCSQTSSTPIGQYKTWPVGSEEVFEDVTVEAFHRRVRSGEVFFNPMESTKTTWASTKGVGESLVKPDGIMCGNSYYTIVDCECSLGYTYEHVKSCLPALFDGRGYPLAPKIVATDEAEDLIAEASTAAMANRGKANANLWESMAEADKTLGLLPGVSREISTIIGAAQANADSAPKGIRARGRAVASLYLMYRYGISPLVSDLQKMLTGIHSKVGASRSTSRGFASLSADQHFQASFTWGRGERVSHIYAGEVLDIRAMSLDEYYATKAHNMGFSLKGLTTLPWELLPYSFVLDWFVNAGDFIGALVPAFGFKQLGACVVQTSTRIATYQPAVLTGRAGWEAARQSTDTCTVTTVHKTRVSGLPAPRLTIRGDFRLSNATRAADALALLAQRLGSPPWKRGKQ